MLKIQKTRRSPPSLGKSWSIPVVHRQLGYFALFRRPAQRRLNTMGHPVFRPHWKDQRRFIFSPEKRLWTLRRKGHWVMVTMPNQW